jgi:hypothetical protein
MGGVRRLGASIAIPVLCLAMVAVAAGPPRATRAAIPEPSPVNGILPVDWIPMNTGLGHPVASVGGSPIPETQHLLITPNVLVYDLAFDPNLPTTMYAATFGEGLWKSLDSGADWFPLEPACALDPVFPVPAAQTEWNLALNAAALLLSFNICYLTHVVADPSFPNTVWVSGYTCSNGHVDGGGIAESVDGGITFQASAPLGYGNGVPISAITVARPNPTAPAQIIAGGWVNGVGCGAPDSSSQTNYGIWNVTWGTSGPSWSGPTALPDLPTTSNCPSTPPRAQANVITHIAIDPVNSNVAFASTMQGLWESLNAGATWSNVLNPDASFSGSCQLYTVALTTPVNGVATAPNTVFAGSQDGRVYAATVSATGSLGAFSIIFNQSGCGSGTTALNLVYSLVTDNRNSSILYAGEATGGTCAARGPWLVRYNASSGSWTTTLLNPGITDDALGLAATVLGKSYSRGCGGPAFADPTTGGSIVQFTGWAAYSEDPSLFFPCLTIDLVQSPILSRLLYGAFGPAGVWVRSEPQS